MPSFLEQQASTASRGAAVVLLVFGTFTTAFAVPAGGGVRDVVSGLVGGLLLLAAGVEMWRSGGSAVARRQALRHYALALVLIALGVVALTLKS